MLDLLLIQVRTDDMRAHEAACVRARLEGLPVTVTPFDAYLNRLSEEHLVGIDGIIIGGSGEFCVSERKIPEVLDNVSEFLRIAREAHVPMLGICFGHQIMSHAFGGEVVMDVTRQELGTYPITLTEEGIIDPLFVGIPSGFLSQEGHKDHVTVLPPGAVLLATTEKSANQAFTFPGEMIYGVQFHPELTKADVATRLNYYRDLYLKNVPDLSSDKDPYLQVLEKTVETPEASTILPAFATLLLDRYSVTTSAPGDTVASAFPTKQI